MAASAMNIFALPDEAASTGTEVAHLAVSYVNREFSGKLVDAETTIPVQPIVFGLSQYYLPNRMTGGADQYRQYAVITACQMPLHADSCLLL